MSGIEKEAESSARKACNHAQRDLVQWPRAVYWDKPWNPWLGCVKCSPACENCYANSSAERFNQSFVPHETKKVSPPTKGVVFCGNMTDLFGQWVEAPLGFIMSAVKHQLRGRGASAYLWLTKRVERMADAICDLDFNAPEMASHYFGFTAENQEWYNRRMAVVNERFPSRTNLWISAEPLLGPIDLRLADVCIMPKVVMVGCESGSSRRPCNVEWIEDIVLQCRFADIPVFVKQLDLGGKCERDITKFPTHLQIRQVPWAETTNI